jgi:uncharacterized protein (TIGR03435 family)
VKRLLTALFVSAVIQDGVLGQTPVSRPAFEIADIRVSTRQNPGLRGGGLRGTRYELRNATMVDLIRTAYNVQPERVIGGPSWLEWNRFDIAALAPEGTTPERLREMLKALLAERFMLVVREDIVPATAMALRLAGPHKLREAPRAGGCQGRAAPEPNGVIAQTIACSGLTIAQLAEQLPRGAAASAYLPGGQPVIDETGLSGFWEFQLKFTPRALLGQAGSDGISLQAGLEKLGLKLEPKPITVPAIAVETVNVKFTPNAADIARRLPPLPPPSFEVASLRPSAPDAQQRRVQLLPNGQVNISAMPLSLMFALAWDLPDDHFVAGPDWLETPRFDVQARAFVTPKPESNAQFDDDLLRLMLRGLIVERFQVKYHMEDRPMPAFDMVVDGPKMTKADPATRTRCIEGAPSDPAAAKLLAFVRQWTCQNVSMEQFGQLLPSIAGGYTRVPVHDRTGLSGGYNFTLSFSTSQQVQQATPTTDAGKAGSDSPVALSLGDAVRRQLGVRLVDTKRRVPVLVIDSISQTPTSN